jgi:BASS family bile acid:Na+ symporter
MDLASILRLALSISIMLVVFGLGLHARPADAFYLFRHPGLLLRSLLSMSVVMPLVAAALVVAFDLPAPVEVALVALAVSPVPPMLPRKQVKAGGDAAYAIGLCVAIALFAIVTVPIEVTWFSHMFDRTGVVSAAQVAKVVLSSVLLPLAVGIAFSRWLPALAARIARPVTMLGLGLLVVAALPLLYMLWPTVQSFFGDGTALVIACMVVVALVVGHALGGPDPDTRTVLALSTASRHPAVALAIAVASGEQAKFALAAILLYTLVAGVVSVPYVVWRKRQSGMGQQPAPSGSRTGH